MIDDDLDAPEDFENEHEKGPEGGHSPRPSLREIWDNNPSLKIVAMVGVLVVGFGIYMLFSTSESTPTKLNVNPTSKTIPGSSLLDTEYHAAIDQANQAHANQAAQEGSSHIDIPTAVNGGSAIKPPTAPEAKNPDVLEEWKKIAESSRLKQAKDAIDEENQAPAPEVVPKVEAIRPQEVKQDPNLSRHLMEQMRDIIGKQTIGKATTLSITKEDSVYEAAKKAQADNAKLASAANTATHTNNNTSTASSGSTNRVIVAAGTIDYAQLLTQLNSDLPGPVLAQVLSGPFTGGRLIGKLTANDECECLAIEFKEVVKDTVSYKIDAYGVDQNTTLTGIDATSVDHHYFVRYVLPAAASILTGYSQAASQVGQTQTATAGVGTETATATANERQSIFAGLTTGSQAIGNDLNKDANRPTTIVVAEGTTMGVLFIDTVTTKDAMQ